MVAPLLSVEARLNKRAIERIKRRILDWYGLYHRDLPWRRTKDPYAIWVSEIMLQQTQVDTVIPYFQRFIDRFPSVEALAKASLEEVLKVWENMGYYTRARHLHEAAREILLCHDGRVPNSEEELRSLPGVGAYTAGAILSLAFGERVPAVDGNVRRVLSRLCYITDPLEKPKTQKAIYAIAEVMVPERNAADFNQGLMELGALVCSPRDPSCSTCPVKAHCLALKRHKVNCVPLRSRKVVIPHKHMTAAVFNGKTGGRVLIVRRPPHGLLGGLWKFPGGEKRAGESLGEALERTVAEEVGIVADPGREIASVKHAYTHFRVTMHVFQCHGKRGRPKALGCDQWKWIRPKEIQAYPFSKVDRKVMDAMDIAYQ